MGPQVNLVEQWYFADKKQTTGLIVDANNFFIHSTNYNVFEEMLENYIHVLDKFNQTVNGFSYNKLGLRYVHFIEDSDKNIHPEFLGFNLSSCRGIEKQYISKAETFQKTCFGAARVRASTFNDEDNEYTFSKCMPPDLIETVNKLKFSDKSFVGKWTVLDIDHYTTSSELEDFNDIKIKEKFHKLHDVITIVFQTAITDDAIRAWS